MIVVLDSNVGISALQFGGAPQLALERAITVDELAISDFIEHEIIRVLNRKFWHPENSARAILQEYSNLAIRVSIRGTVSGVCRDSGDDAILETVLNSQAGLIVAGDKDLLTLRKYQNISIITPASYALGPLA